MSVSEKKEKTVDFTKGCYGPKLKISEVKKWLLDGINDNLEREKGRFSLNIWGAPGVGKSALVKALENETFEWNGKKFDSVKVVDIPLAQIEEMGDILGLPETYVEMEREVPDISKAH